MLAATGEIPPEKWLTVAAELRELAAGSTATAEVTLWGGEPLLYPAFDRLAAELHRQGLAVAIVTNGTLLDRHLEAVAEHVDRVHISVDGLRSAHDAVRGAGVFDRLCANLDRLNSRRRGRLIFLTTISDFNVKGIAKLPFKLAELGPDEIVLQPLMYLKDREISEFRRFCQIHFHTDYPELAAWRREDDREYLAELRKELSRIEQTTYPVPVHFTAHHYPALEGTGCCQAPWRRVHIRCDGAVGFCTDYFNFSAGSILKQPLAEIFRGPAAKQFRRAVENHRLAICDHCPWRRQKL